MLSPPAQQPVISIPKNSIEGIKRPDRESSQTNAPSRMIVSAERFCSTGGLRNDSSVSRSDDQDELVNFTVTDKHTGLQTLDEGNIPQTLMSQNGNSKSQQ